MTVTFTARFSPKPGAEAAVEAVLRDMVAPTRAEPGCRIYDLYAVEDGFLLMETYVDAAAVEAHRAADYFLAYRAAIAELLAEPIARSDWRPLDVAGDVAGLGEGEVALALSLAGG